MDPGSLYALGTAVTWAVAVVLFKKSGDYERAAGVTQRRRIF